MRSSKLTSTLHLQNSSIRHEASRLSSREQWERYLHFFRGGSNLASGNDLPPKMFQVPDTLGISPKNSSPLVLHTSQTVPYVPNKLIPVLEDLWPVRHFPSCMVELPCSHSILERCKCPNIFIHWDASFDNPLTCFAWIRAIGMACTSPPYDYTLSKSCMASHCPK